MLISTVIGLSVLWTTVYACGAGGSGGDYEIIENPTLTMDISPPVGWTFFPIKPSDSGSTTWFFIGQSNDTTIAKQRADTEIQSAMIEALVAAQLPVYGVKIGNDFNPVQVENAFGKTTGAGPLYGRVESGAVTLTAIGTTGGGELLYTTYHRQCEVTLMQMRTTRYNMNIVKNNFLQKMSLKYNARFIGEVTIT